MFLTDFIKSFALREQSKIYCLRGCQLYDALGKHERCVYHEIVFVSVKSAVRNFLHFSVDSQQCYARKQSTVAQSYKMPLALVELVAEEILLRLLPHNAPLFASSANGVAIWRNFVKPAICGRRRLLSVPVSSINY